MYGKFLPKGPRATGWTTQAHSSTLFLFFLIPLRINSLEFSWNFLNIIIDFSYAFSAHSNNWQLSGVMFLLQKSN